MANNGYYRANGVSYDNHFFVNWQVATQEQGNNRTLINWQSYAHFNGSDSQLDNGYTNSNVGGLWSNGGRVRNYQGNIATKDIALASGSFWVGHGADGRGFVQFAGGITFYQMGRSEGTSGVWELPTIARNVDITGSSGNVTDETANIFLQYYNPGGFPVDAWIELIGVTGNTHYAQRNGYASGANFNITPTEWDAIRTAMANTGQTTFNYVLKNNGGSGNYAGTNYAYNVNIINANPTFPDFTYRDKNSATVAVTGNDQYFIQGQSELEVAITSANKATALKKSTMSKYNASVSSISQDITYSTSNIAQSLGVLNANADVPLVVKAIDSRAYETSISKTLKVLPYVVPQVTATAKRVNNFETSTNIHIEGVISRLTIASTDKNTVNTTNGVQYRYKKTTDVSWGSWTNRASTTTNGNVASADFAINLDRNFSWNLQVKITDKLQTSTLDILVTVGIPIFRISTYDNLVYNNEQPLMPSHIGMVIMSVALTTASAVQALYGGTWVAWGTGRTPVGVDTSQTEFNTVEKTGGHKLLQSHAHVSAPITSDGNLVAGGGGGSSGANLSQGGGAYRLYPGVNGGSTGGGNAENLQPFITTYMYKRTA